MKSIFSDENPIIRFLSKLCDLMLIGLMTTVCCIPVLTAGAAITAMYYVMIKMHTNTEGSIIKDYFKSFKKNFLKASIIWCCAILVGLGFWQWVKYLFSEQSVFGETTSLIMILITCLLFFAYACVMVFVYPILARFDNTLMKTVKNALLIGITQLPRTLIVTVMTAILVYCIYLYTPLLFPIVFLTFSFVTYVWCRMFVKVFRKFGDVEETYSDDVTFQFDDETGKSEEVKEEKEEKEEEKEEEKIEEEVKGETSDK